VYDDHSTCITFFPLSKYNKDINQERIKEMQEALAAQRKEGRSTIVTKEKEITLEKMKEQVMMSIFSILDEAKKMDVGGMGIL